MNDLSRRNLLVTVGKISMGSAALSILGCGGLFSGSAAPGGNLIQHLFTGSVTLPPGTDLTKLKVFGPLGSKPLSGSSFQVKGFEQFPVLVSVVDPTNGKTLLLGMLDPQTSVHSLDAANCAATLLFVALGGSQLFGEERQAFWTAVLALAALPALVTVVSDRLAADLYALENQDSQIIAALDTAAKSVPPPAPAATQAKSPKSSVKLAKGRANDDITILFLAPHPGQGIIGLTGYNANNQGIGLSSYRRRETTVHMYLAAGRNAEGQIRGPVLPEVIPAFKVPAKGSTDIIPVSLYQDDVADTYDLICLTPLFDSYPSTIFTDGVYESEKAVWRADLAKMYKRAEVGLVCKILLEAVGMSGVTLNSDLLDAVIQNLTGLGGEVANLVLTAADGTDLSGGVKAFAAQARSSDTAALDILQAIAPLVQASNPVLYYDLSHRNYVSEQLVAFRAALRLLAYTGAMGLSLELGPEYKDLTGGENSDGSPEENGARCNFNVIREDIRLTPNGGNYSPGTNVSFHVSVDGHEGPFTYGWQLASVSNATLDDGHGHNEFQFQSDQATVTLKTHGNSIGNAIVNVEVFTGTQGNLVSIGVASTTLTRVGTTGLFVDSFPFQGATWVDGMAIYEKPKTDQGGNHYKGGRLRCDIIYDDLSHPETHSTQHMEFPIPAYTGLPASSETPPQFTGTRIHPDVGGGSSNYASIDVYDMGDRLVLLSIKGPYYPSTSQQDIDNLYHTIEKFIADTTLAAVFYPST